MIFTTYKDNRPVGLHDCSEWEIATVAAGLEYVSGWAKENQYIQNGAFVDFPERPNEFAIWDWDSLSWKNNEELAIEATSAKRKELLSASDWTQLPDVPSEKKAQWAEYRQNLRDITAQDGYPFAIIWPTEPR